MQVQALEPDELLGRHQRVHFVLHCHLNSVHETLLKLLEELL